MAMVAIRRGESMGRPIRFAVDITVAGKIVVTDTVVTLSSQHGMETVPPLDSNDIRKPYAGLPFEILSVETWLMSMNLVSVNVSRPIEVRYGNGTIRTGIFKKPVAGSVRVETFNLEGDGQADLDNHGGEHKSVYAYSQDHYPYWRRVLDREEMPHGQFGENLTVAGLNESESCIGDQLQIGSALFTITQPRVPCFKLGIRFAEEKLPRLFSESGHTGFYLRVIREGVIQAGDPVEVVERGYDRVSVRALFTAFLNPGDEGSHRTLERALEVPELSSEWQARIRKRLKRGVE